MNIKEVEWYFIFVKFIYSHLYYTTLNYIKYQIAVKVHGVSLSRARYSVFSRRFQFRQVYVRDSQAVVTPFMRDANYAPRNFATLGQLGLLPPFTHR